MVVISQYIHNYTCPPHTYTQPTSRTPLTHQDSPVQFISVIKPLALVDIHHIAPLLLHRALFLTRLGVNKTVLYDRGIYSRQMEDDGIMQALFSSNHLQVMRFGHEQSGLPQPFEYHWTPLDKGAWYEGCVASVCLWRMHADV